MIRYPAIIEGGEDDYGIVFPDLPGIVAMGDTLEQAMENAEEALRTMQSSQREMAFHWPLPVHRKL